MCIFLSNRCLSCCCNPIKSHWQVIYYREVLLGDFYWHGVLQMEMRQGRMLIFMIVAFPHNDNNNLSHLSKSNLTVFMSSWRRILIKSCSCICMYFNPCRDHLKFQFSIQDMELLHHVGSNLELRKLMSHLNVDLPAN